MPLWLLPGIIALSFALGLVLGVAITYATNGEA